MTGIEQFSPFDGDDALPQPPQWITPILEREAREKQARDTKRDHEGVRRVLAIDERLLELGIEPLQPAEWSPSANQLHNAVLLEPGHAAGDYRVEAGWQGAADGHVALYVYDHDTCGRRYVGPLETLEQAAAARFGAPSQPPEPVDHTAEAARHLHSAETASGDRLDTPQGALLAATCAQARATLALEETLSRIGVHAQLRHIAATGAGTTTAATDDAVQERRERALLAAVFPETAAAAPLSRNDALATAHLVAGNLLSALPTLPALDSIGIGWNDDEHQPKLWLTVTRRPGPAEAEQCVRDWAQFLGGDADTDLEDHPRCVVGTAQYCGLTVRIWCHYEARPAAADE